MHFTLESLEIGLLSDRRETNFYSSAYKEIAFVFISLHVPLGYSLRWKNAIYSSCLPHTSKCLYR
jgi:hypothetical protein